MQARNTIRLSDSPRGIRAAAGLLGQGETVAFPTETVYGLGADARNALAVAEVFAAKGRPGFNPLIVHVADLAAAEALVDMPPLARDLAAAFWPGPLALVLPARPGNGIADLVSAGLPTLAVRVPDHPVAAALLSTFGGPIAAPSANLSGAVSPTSADHVMDGLSGRIAAVVDAGATAVGLESTILGVTDHDITLLRPGGLPLEALGMPVTSHDDTASGIVAPGQLASHYAPAAALRLNAAAPRPGESWLGFGHDAIAQGLNLSPGGDLREAAANLFGHLRALDAAGAPIAVARVPDHGLGLAINDRLGRAAAPRPGPQAPLRR